jgi:hypothetical protein
MTRFTPRARRKDTFISIILFAAAAPLARLPVLKPVAVESNRRLEFDVGVAEGEGHQIEPPAVSSRLDVSPSAAFVSPLPCRVEASLAEAPPASSANSVFGVVNHEKPQSKQTKSFGNAHTPGLSRSLKFGKWMIISAENSARLPVAHDKQDITNPQELTEKCKQPKNGCLFKMEHSP